jgi:hypothetical protein
MDGESSMGDAPLHLWKNWQASTGIVSDARYLQCGHLQMSGFLQRVARDGEGLPPAGDAHEILESYRF